MTKLSNNDLLEYSSIQKYLDLAIGKKKAKIGKNLTFNDKIKSVSLSQYLRGVSLFFEYSEMFDYPSEILDFWKKNRDNDNQIDKLFKEITNYPIWLKNVHKLSDTTCVSYQAHIRGFLTNNNIRLTFKNYKPKTKKKTQQNKLGITYEEMKEFAHKIKTYINDLDLKLLCEFAHSTGLAYREIADITFGDLRNKDFDQEYILIASDREKSSIDYANFINPNLKELILDYLRVNQNKKNSDKLFGNDLIKAYHNLDRRFNTAYVKCCENHFPRFLTIKTSKDNLKKLFSIHSFRSVFKTACDTLRIIPEHRDLFIAHKSEKMTNYDLISKELLIDYELVEQELFGKKTTESATIDQVFDILKALVQNNGKRKAIFRKYQENQEIDITTEIRGTLFLEQFALNLEKRIEKKIMENVMNEVKKNLKNLSLKDLLTSL